jgi:hypothetical protein
MYPSPLMDEGDEYDSFMRAIQPVPSRKSNFLSVDVFQVPYEPPNGFFVMIPHPHITPTMPVIGIAFALSGCLALLPCDNQIASNWVSSNNMSVGAMVMQSLTTGSTKAKASTRGSRRNLGINYADVERLLGAQQWPDYLEQRQYPCLVAPVPIDASFHVTSSMLIIPDLRCSPRYVRLFFKQTT